MYIPEKRRPEKQLLIAQRLLKGLSKSSIDQHVCIDKNRKIQKIKVGNWKSKVGESNSVDNCKF